MRSCSPALLYMITVALVPQVFGGKAFIHVVYGLSPCELYFGALPARFGSPLPAEGLKRLLMEVMPANACQPTEGPPNSSSVFIALIQRYNCSIARKVFHTQQAGYLAVIVHVETASHFVGMVSKKDVKQHIHISSMFIKTGSSRILKLYSRKWTSVTLVPRTRSCIQAKLCPMYPCLCSTLFASVATLVACLLIVILKNFKWIKKNLRSPKTGKEQPNILFINSTYQECAICLENYLECDIMTVLSCSHAFHRICVNYWHFTQVTNKTCPFCTQKVIVLARFHAKCLWQIVDEIKQSNPWEGQHQLFHQLSQWCSTQL